MIREILMSVFCTLTISSFSQTNNDSINKEQAEKHIFYLAADRLKGRVNFTKEQLEVAEYINKEFFAYGLQPFPGFTNFYQPFRTHSDIILPAYTRCDTLTDSILYNIVGVLPGSGKDDEIIIFSAHYDHVDKDLQGRGGYIFNGANDDASGTTAVLMLARYFAIRNNNERTIIFCLFAGEELGLYGSTEFAKLINPGKIKAVINIEMIGRTNRTGKKAFFVTGSAHSDLMVILEKNLMGEKISIREEGQDLAGLFYRSDNYSFAKKSIIAHSIMCSDDKEPCYHQISTWN